MRRLALSMVIVVSLVRCGGGSSPTEPSPPGTPSTTLLQGQTLNAIDGTVAPNLSVRVGGRFPITTDSSGFFQTDLSNQSPTTVVVSGGSVVERETRMAPSAARTRVAMIPSSFDLGAFDEMFRSSNAQLQRWTSRPALVILGSVMEYRTGSDQTYAATNDQLTEAEVDQLKAHLTEGLSLLTGNTYTTFASIEIERPGGGTRVNTLRAGQIVVGRYNGVVSMEKTIGYGLWSERPDGSIGGGAMYLDRGFDRDDNRRRLLRIHELGHALGYQHVESRTSIMNPSIGPEPTEFDRAGAIIAFARPVGNKSPDIDPPSMALSASTGAGRWVAPATACALPIQ